MPKVYRQTFGRICRYAADRPLAPPHLQKYKCPDSVVAWTSPVSYIASCSSSGAKALFCPAQLSLPVELLQLLPSSSTILRVSASGTLTMLHSRPWMSLLQASACLPNCCRGGMCQQACLLRKCKSTSRPSSSAGQDSNRLLKLYNLTNSLLKTVLRVRLLHAVCLQLTAAFAPILAPQSISKVTFRALHALSRRSKASHASHQHWTSGP